MNKGIYARLAAGNIKKNAKIYVPYILASVFTVMMFYIMLFITTNDGIGKMPGKEALQLLMILGSIVIAIFAVAVLLYANSFLIKRRKKELGLYNILGMGKRHIGKVMAYENLYTALFSIAAGIGLGILFSKLMLLLLYKLLDFDVPFGFSVSPIAITLTVILFAGIFFLTLIINLMHVHSSKPIELLRGSSVGEKEPKTKWVLTLIGLLTLGTGYAIALTIESPLKALVWFFGAVILVIIGTYCLFCAGSIAVLKILRRKKSYYYKTKHFISVSGMLYRMKQNAAGLANICILSTMVLVMLSSTVSLYFGLEDGLRAQFPRNIEVRSTQNGKEDYETVKSAIDSAVAEEGIAVKNAVRYRYKSFTFKQNGNSFAFDRYDTYADSDGAVVFFITLDEYNRMQNKNESLSQNELLVYSPNASYKYKDIYFGDIKYTVKSVPDELNVEAYFSLRYFDTYYFIVPSEQNIVTIYDNMTKGIGEWDGLSFYYGFDIEGNGETQLKAYNAISQKLADYDYSVSSAEENRNQFLAIYGGLFFLGIFLGTLFTMATVLIMYYKQISEGYDDQKRFEIMQQVGISRSEIKSAIRSQVLIVFFLPLAVAAIHIAAAFNMITRLMALLNLTNVALFAWCTVGTILVFALLYAAFYTFTAKAYYRIVKQ
jgi:putative ABC transport system permease protein